MRKVEEKLRIGVIGLGRVATATHLPVLNLLNEVKIVACAEANRERVCRVKKFLKDAIMFENYEELFASRLVDAVYVCVPPHVHFEVSMMALENGIHVLCEKPMGRNQDEAAKMSSLALKKNLVLMPGFKYRYNRNLQRAVQLITSGLLGNILQIVGTFMTPGPYISWDPKTEWYLGEEQGGVVYDIGGHIIDLIYLLVGENITKISAEVSRGYFEYPTPTNVSCSFLTRSGTVGTVSFGWRSAVDLIDLSIFGTAGTISVSLKRFDYYNAGTDPKDRIVNHLKNAWLEANSACNRIVSIIRGKEVSCEDLLQAKTFVKCIRKGDPPPVSADIAVYNHRVLQAIQNSIAAEKSVAI